MFKIQGIWRFYAAFWRFYAVFRLENRSASEPCQEPLFLLPPEALE